MNCHLASRIQGEPILMALLPTLTLSLLATLPLQAAAPGTAGPSNEGHGDLLPAPQPLSAVPGPSGPSLPAFVPPAVPTVGEFLATFKPTPGQHDVVLLHPFTHKPVQVRFWLPPGVSGVYPRRHSLLFDAPHYWRVEIWFKPLGGVEVDKVYYPATFSN
jgi:hypothetical protein